MAPKRDIIVIGASAGGIEALIKLLGDLPHNLAASVFIVCHISPYSPGMLPGILARNSKLPVGHGFDREIIQMGKVYVAPPDHHLLIEDGTVRVTQGPKENHFRPAVDPLFRSAAYSHGPQVIGVVLTGSLDDGTAGLWTIKEQGGVAIVQDPNEAMFPDMPLNAMMKVPVDHRVRLAEMAPLLVKLTSESVVEKGAKPVSDKLKIEVDFAKQAPVEFSEMNKLGEVSSFTCPECHGSLWQMKEGGILRFRCRTGHAYSAQTLLSDLSTSVEAVLWMAVRSLEESAELASHLAGHLRQHGQEAAAVAFLAQAHLIKQRIHLVRQTLPGQPHDNDKEQAE